MTTGERARSTMGTDRELHHDAIKRALSGQSLTNWLPGGDWQAGRSQVVSGSCGGS
jgi:hypothetical protein